MPKERKEPPSEALLRLRETLARNLDAHMAANAQLQGLAETAQAMKIAELTGVGKNTVLRALGKAGGDDKDRGDMRLDTLVKLADFFGTTPQQLLRDPRSRPTLDAPRRERARARTEGSDSEADRAALQRHRRA